MNSKDHLPPEEFEKTVIISADDNVTIKLPQKAAPAGSESPVRTSGAASGNQKDTAIC